MLHCFYFLISFPPFSLFSLLHFLLSFKVKDQARCQKHYNHSWHGSCHNILFLIISNTAMNIFLIQMFEYIYDYYCRAKFTDSKSVSFSKPTFNLCSRKILSITVLQYMHSTSQFIFISHIFFSWTISCKMESHYYFIYLIIDHIHANSIELRPSSLIYFLLYMYYFLHSF